MDKKALIAIGVIGALGIATYAFIVYKNTPAVTGASGVQHPATTNTSNSNTTYVTLAQSAMCKLFKIGCPDVVATSDSSIPSTAIS